MRLNWHPKLYFIASMLSLFGFFLGLILILFPEAEQYMFLGEDHLLVDGLAFSYLSHILFYEMYTMSKKIRKFEQK